MHNRTGVNDDAASAPLNDPAIRAAYLSGYLAAMDNLTPVVEARLASDTDLAELLARVLTREETDELLATLRAILARRPAVRCTDPRCVRCRPGVASWTGHTAPDCGGPQPR